MPITPMQRLLTGVLFSFVPAYCDVFFLGIYSPLILAFDLGVVMLLEWLYFQCRCNRLRRQQQASFINLPNSAAEGTPAPSRPHLSPPFAHTPAPFFPPPL